MPAHRPIQWTGLFAGVLFVFSVATGQAEDPPRVKTRSTTNITATVQALNLETRELTLKNLQGNLQTVVAGPEIKRLNEIKVGDVLKINRDVALTLELREPTAAEKEFPPVTSAVILRTGSTTPAGVRMRATRSVVTVTAVDSAAGSVTLRDSQGRTFTQRGNDKTGLKQIRAGQALLAEIEENLALSLEPSAK